MVMVELNICLGKAPIIIMRDWRKLEGGIVTNNHSSVSIYIPYASDKLLPTIFIHQLNLPYKRGGCYDALRHIDRFLIDGKTFRFFH